MVAWAREERKLFEVPRVTGCAGQARRSAEEPEAEAVPFSRSRGCFVRIQRPAEGAQASAIVQLAGWGACQVGFGAAHPMNRRVRLPRCVKSSIPVLVASATVSKMQQTALGLILA